MDVGAGPEGNIYQLGGVQRGESVGIAPPYAPCGFPRMAVSLETSSQNRDVGGYRLRRFMLKMTISPDTSSQNGHVEIGREIFGSAKMGLSPETSSKQWDVEKAGCFNTSYVKN